MSSICAFIGAKKHTWANKGRQRQIFDFNRFKYQDLEGLSTRNHAETKSLLWNYHSESASQTGRQDFTVPTINC